MQVISIGAQKTLYIAFCVPLSLYPFKYIQYSVIISFRYGVTIAYITMANVSIAVSNILLRIPFEQTLNTEYPLNA